MIRIIVVASLVVFFAACRAPTTPGSQTPSPRPCTVTAPMQCPTEKVQKYSDIAPIIEARCVTCHYQGSQDSWPLTEYKHVADWQDTVRADVLDCSMPPPEAQSEITDDERVAILTWVLCGALQ